MYKIKLILFTTLVSLSCPVLAASIESYKKDADALCEVYNPKNWQDYVKEHNLNELFKELGVKTREAIKTKEFRDIFQRYLDEKPPEFKSYLKKQVSDLIGKEWKCSYFDEFAEPPLRKEIQLTVVGVKKLKQAGKNKEIVVTIDAGGKFYVNDMPLINNEEVTVMQAFKIVAKGKTPAIIINADAKVSNALVTRVIYVANSLGLKSVSIQVE